MKIIFAPFSSRQKLEKLNRSSRDEKKLSKEYLTKV